MALVHRTKRHGGGIIKWKLFMSMFLLCGVALLNLSGASAVSNSNNSNAIITTNVTPNVTAVDPSNNAVNFPVNKSINVTFNKPVEAGNNWIEFRTASGTAVPFSTSINGSVLTITPKSALVKATKYVLILHTGSVTDLTGNNLAYYGTTFTTNMPMVTSSDPSSNARNIAVNKTITVTFSGPVKASSGSVEFRTASGTAVPFSTSINGSVLTITPKSALVKATKYVLILHTGSVTDLAGNKLAYYGTTFTTDNVAPTVTSSDPSNNTIDVVLNKVIKVTFSEPVKAGTNWIELKDSKGANVPIATSINDKVLTIIPTKDLSEEMKYTLVLHTGSVTDLAGNNLAYYATRFTTDTPAVTFTSAQILDAAARVKAYVDANHGLPGYITIGSTNVSMAQFLQMMSVDLLQINNGSNAPIVLPNVKAPTNPSDNVGTGNIYTTEYLSLAQQLKNTANGTAPNYISSSQGNIQFDSAVYMYSRILAYYASHNNVLPNYASIYPWTTITHPNTFNQAAFNQIMSTASGFWYHSGISTAAGIEAYHCGDCWAMSAYLYNKLTAAGIHAKIIQYATEYASNHRSVQYYKDGCWYDVPYRAWGFNSMFRNTQSSGYIVAQS